MGVYIYKTTANEVILETGERASVAAYAYKAGLRNGSAHAASGAAAADRAAANGKRHPYVVLGHVNKEGRIEVDSAEKAMKMGCRGSFSDHLLDKDWERLAVARPASKKVDLTRSREEIGEADELGWAPGVRIVEKLIGVGSWTEIKRHPFRSFSSRSRA